MSEKKLPNGMKLVFAPGCFDNFEGTQEELDQLVKDIEQGFNDGTFFDKATELTLGDVEDMTDIELEALSKFIDIADINSGNRTLQ